MRAVVLVCAALVHLKPSTAQDFKSIPASVYYDVKSGEPLKVVSIQNFLMNGSSDSLRRVTIARSNGCTCQELYCGCCAGINFQQLGFSREACLNFTYVPYEFAIRMEMFMNSDLVYANSVSAKFPPPVCIPVPTPYIPIGLDLCVKLFDLHTPGPNLHMCVDLETRIQEYAVLILHFDCMLMGAAGVSLVKPGNEIVPPSSTDSPQVNVDVFDPVTETKIKHVHEDSR